MDSYEVRQKKYIIAIDAGSTGTRAGLFDKAGIQIANVYQETPLIRGSNGAAEHDPAIMKSALFDCLLELTRKNHVNAREIAAVGLTNQRSSFCFWEKSSGRPLSNLINWQDTRASVAVEKMNRSLLWGVIRLIAGIGGLITRNQLMQATSCLKWTTDHPICRVKWLLDTDKDLARKCETGEACFGTLDSWLLHCLTGGRKHKIDITNASCTAMYDPFKCQWNTVFCRLFNLPLQMLPNVVPSDSHFGFVGEEIWGRSDIPITAMIGDQHAALFGHGCLNTGEVKLSLGSGGFVNIIVGQKPAFSKEGLFPIIALRNHNDIVYMLEGQVAAVGTAIDWVCQYLGLAKEPQELNRLAAGCRQTGALVFIPTLTGIRYPYFKTHLNGLLFGVTQKTDRPQIARAFLEGIALRVAEILAGAQKSTGVKILRIKADGGAARVDTLLQIIADLTGCPVERSQETEMTLHGAARLAGQSANFWSADKIRAQNQKYVVFTPRQSAAWRQAKLEAWQKTVKWALKCRGLPKTSE